MSDLASGQLCRRYSFADIRLATQNFDDQLVVGQGGFGKVYKGHINSGEISSDVAIKRLDSMSDQGAPEFRAEIEMLSKLRHSHLVSLLGYCDEGKEMILVYDYMPHGTVDHHLHISITPLSWMQRLRISIGAARGLDYLHTGAGTQQGVIHRDVKSSNILLDENWAAKISDFGLAKIGPINQPSSYVNTAIKGTFGYLDPEFFMTGKLTRKTDVFAFGVVLFELLSGRHAVDTKFPEEEWSLARWAQKCVKRRNLHKLVCPEIRGQVSPKSLKEFAQISYRCLHSRPKERPTMSEIVVGLQLSQALQEKFDNSAEPAGVTRFTWKMPKYFVLPTKENTGHDDTKRDGRIDIDCYPMLTEDGGDHPEVLPGSEQILTQDLKVFSYTDLKRATGNFQNPIMWSGHDWVFKGWVHEKMYSPSELDVGLAITVKRLRSSKWDLQLLGEFSHPNLVRLLGFCLKDRALYLVLEFMEKRSLRDYLLKGAAAELPFVMRIKIAVGVARGLVFLQKNHLIFMGWILDTNEIWLDKDFNAKIFCFDAAMSRLAQYPLIGLSSQRQQYDLHGLGLLLMEMLTWRPILTEARMDLVEKEYLSSKIAEIYRDMMEDVGDRQMKSNGLQIEGARELLPLVLKCTRYRYTLEEALKELEHIYSKVTEM